MVMKKKAFGIVSNVNLYTKLYNGKIALFDKFSVTILKEFIDPKENICISTNAHFNNVAISKQSEKLQQYRHNTF